MTLEQARRVVEQERVNRHEAAHAAAATCVGLTVARIHSARPDGVRGKVSFRHGGYFKGRPWEYAQTVLAGPLVSPIEGTPRWPLLKTRWPLLKGSDTVGDEAQLCRLFEDQGWDETDWNRLWTETRELLASDRFTRLGAIFEQWLARYPVIEGKLLQAIFEVEARYEVEDRCRKLAKETAWNT
jgi:hypothetical protein